MGYIGDIFTWRRGRMRERLDRAVCDPRWSAMFPLVGVVNEDFGKSDHRPILINTEYNAGMHAIPQRGPLRFEARWLCEESVENIIQTSWERAKQLHAGSALSDHTEDVHKALHRWDKEVLKGPRRRLRELQKELNIVMSGELSDEAVAKQKEIQMSIENLLEQEELYWVQRGRVNWLKHGDQNTAFFHRSATARRKRNFIKSLKTESGDVVEDSDQLMSLATGYFQNLFSTDVQNPDQGVFDKVIPRVTEDMNQILLAPYTREEVKKALFNIGDLKAPGPDGLHAVFYKRFWHIIGEDLTDEVWRLIAEPDSLCARVLRAKYFPSEGGSALEVLLRNRSVKAPLLPDVDRNDLIATAVWEANVAAHTLASQSEGTQSIVWIEDPPDYITSILANDVSVMAN
ncbi:uncharacterized protein [Lolium perenne]|uniref:uncharacterized protein n=1 Tax=Lolium perenne TaxID=4522 RepID=UPI003A99965D